jgi:hypothetical protein
MTSVHDPPASNATFRPKRLYLYLGLGGVIGYPAWAVIGIWIDLTEPCVPHRGISLAIMCGIPAAMGVLSAYLLAAYCRERLTIQGNQITIQGVFRRVEIGLRDVTEARWRLGPEGGSVVLKTATTRVPIDFGTYERDEKVQIIDHLRSVIAPGVQTNWNLFDYKITAPLREPKRTKPGPGEVLLRRNRWDRYLVPGVVSAAVVVVVVWWIMGELRFLAAPVFPVLFWLMMRTLTPAEGMIAQKLSFSMSTELSRLILFLLLWGLVAFGGVMTVEALRPRLGHPDTVLGIGMVVWFSVLFFEAFRSDRRSSRRDREAAGLAAKECGEDRPDAPLVAKDDHWSI